MMDTKENYAPLSLERQISFPPLESSSKYSLETSVFL